MLDEKVNIYTIQRWDKQYKQSAEKKDFYSAKLDKLLSIYDIKMPKWFYNITKYWNHSVAIVAYNHYLCSLDCSWK